MSPPPRKLNISDASAYVLRIGVLGSAIVMSIGIALTFAHHRLPIDRITTARFDTDPVAMLRGVAEARGQAVIELGILLLLATPILRVLTSMLIFAIVERDRGFALITLIVLAMTLTGLFLAR